MAAAASCTNFPTADNATESLKSIAYAVILSAGHLFKLLVWEPVRWLRYCLSGGSAAQTLTEFYSGKVCIITGASSGIGASLAQILSSIPGTIVVISSRSMDKLEEVATMCRMEYPTARVFPVALDLENFETVEEYTTKVLETLRRNGLPPHIDVLINNAGVSSRGAAMETSMATVQKIMVHLQSYFRGPSCVIDLMAFLSAV
jgi:NADP-dependent 3-hydroxy acid dehydrogenase YdfG